MATEILNVQELVELHQGEVQARTDEITDYREGSINDVEAGATALGVNEAMTLIVDRFRKTFFDSADGPEVTGGPDYLEDLAVDHFGDTFARPEAQKAVGVVTFSRPTTGAGNVTIPSGAIVKTAVDSGGESQRFRTLAAVTMTGLSVNASVEAVEAGVKGNVGAGDVSQIETTLTDSSIVVTNSLGFSGGAAVMNDADYRQYIRNKIEAIKGATVAAIEAAAKTVSGVLTATIVEVEKIVKEWDIGSSTTVGDYFRIPYPVLYIADANGTANAALIASVKSVIEEVRAAGVRILVLGASPFALNWTAQLTLNPSGPNFAALSADPQAILDTMTDYVKTLPIGTGFDIATANAAMLAIWGPAGTDDLTAFVTVAPGGNVAGTPGVKIIPGVIKTGSC